MFLLLRNAWTPASAQVSRVAPEIEQLESGLPIELVVSSTNSMSALENGPPCTPAVAMAVIGIVVRPKIDENHIGTLAVCLTTMPLALSTPLPMVQEMPVVVKHL